MDVLFLGVLLLGPRSRVLCLRGVLLLGAFVFQGCVVGGSKREVEDIHLSERDNRGKGRGNSRASYTWRPWDGKGREIEYKNVRVLIKILRNRALNNRGYGASNNFWFASLLVTRLEPYLKMS